MRKPHTLLLPLLLAAPMAWADSCDTIRADIEAKLRAAGVVSYALLTVGVADTLPGKVVGSCSLGKKKIIYQVQGGDTSGLPASGPSTEHPPGQCAEHPAGWRPGQPPGHSDHLDPGAAQGQPGAPGAHQRPHHRVQGWFDVGRRRVQALTATPGPG